jgi:hypothetical protein
MLLEEAYLWAAGASSSSYSCVEVQSKFVHSHEQLHNKIWNTTLRTDLVQYYFICKSTWKFNSTSAPAISDGIQLLLLLGCS